MDAQTIESGVRESERRIAQAGLTKGMPFEEARQRLMDAGFGLILASELACIHGGEYPE